jgi:chromate transport protein ChrA
MNKGPSSQATSQGQVHAITFGEAARVWARVAALSFGGPAGQIAVMHRILVEEKRTRPSYSCWMSFPNVRRNGRLAVASFVR